MHHEEVHLITLKRHNKIIMQESDPISLLLLFPMPISTIYPEQRGIAAVSIGIHKYVVVEKMHDGLILFYVISIL